jgi:hypothetical protein
MAVVCPCWENSCEKEAVVGRYGARRSCCERLLPTIAPAPGRLRAAAGVLLWVAFFAVSGIAVRLILWTLLAGSPPALWM